MRLSVVQEPNKKTKIWVNEKPFVPQWRRYLRKVIGLLCMFTGFYGMEAGAIYLKTRHPPSPEILRGISAMSGFFTLVAIFLVMMIQSAEKSKAYKVALVIVLFFLYFLIDNFWKL